MKLQVYQDTNWHLTLRTLYLASLLGLEDSPNHFVLLSFKRVLKWASVVLQW